MMYTLNTFYRSVQLSIALKYLEIYNVTVFILNRECENITAIKHIETLSINSILYNCAICGDGLCINV